MKISRRTFLASAVAAGGATLIPKVRAEAKVAGDSYATLIDLTRCNGCVDQPTVACVSACREGNRSRFPDPDPDDIRDYWPQKTHEDWSGKKDVTNRLTPYNWLFVQKLTVDGQPVYVPRRCMHCDNPPCSKLCPFGVKHKTAEGPVYIDHNLCFGGAKCRTVCPWNIPQRQAGVGIYTYFQSFIPAGGGVMYKCDLCREKLAKNETPYCIDSCPQQAMLIGKRTEIFAEAEKRAKAYGGDLYGKEENGGTSTIYVSKIPFSTINKVLVSENKAGQPRMHKAVNMLEKQSKWSMMSTAAPLLGAIAAFFAVAVQKGRGGGK